MERPTEKNTPPKKKQKVSDANEEECQYVLHERRRWVVPYYFSFTTHSKKRWWEQALLTIFVKEFSAYSPEYYKEAIEKGRITVNNLTVTTDYIIKNGDKIVHKAHMHEPSVRSQAVEIILETDKLVVINKPASMTTYRSGLYQYNSAVEILRYENPHLQKYKLLPLHRLDRVVSGILILSKCPLFAKRFSQLMKDKQVQKMYLSRVYGRFPEGETICDVPLSKLCFRAGTCSVDNTENGKQAKTKFTFLSYSKELDQSIVLCAPLTGRQHQLRVHLQHLGFPIVNDQLYAPQALLPKPIQRPAYPFPYKTDPICRHCVAEKTDENEFLWDEIFLHACFYSISGEFSFSCTAPLPTWAKESTFTPPLDEKTLFQEP